MVEAATSSTTRRSPTSRSSITVAGLIIIDHPGLDVIYLWLSDPLYGIGVGNTNSIIFLGVLYGLAAIVYVVARLYRRSQGVDLDAIHAEIPAE